MENAVSVQTLQFLYSGALGIGLGILFDVFRVMRYFSPKKKLITTVYDALFWICASVLLLAFVLTFSEGRMRWYVLLGVFSGGFVYMSSASEILFLVMRETVVAIRKALRASSRPVYLLLRKGKNAGYASFRKAKQKMKKKGGDGKRGKKKKEKKHIS